MALHNRTGTVLAGAGIQRIVVGQVPRIVPEMQGAQICSSKCGCPGEEF